MIAAPPTSVTARRRGRPVSMRIRVAISIIAISDDRAAKKSARKNSGRTICPPGTSANNRGIQMNVRPVFPDSMAASASWVDRMANTVGSTAMPASKEAELLPNPIVAALSTTSSSRFM